MAFKVQVGPAQIAIHQGQTVLVTAPDGQVTWPSQRGLYFRDTRVISAWAIYAKGEPWDLLNGGAVAYHLHAEYPCRAALADQHQESGRISGDMSPRDFGEFGAPHDHVDFFRCRFGLRQADTCSFRNRVDAGRHQAGDRGRR